MLDNALVSHREIDRQENFFSVAPFYLLHLTHDTVTSPIKLGIILYADRASGAFRRARRPRLAGGRFLLHGQSDRLFDTFAIAAEMNDEDIPSWCQHCWYAKPYYGLGLLKNCDEGVTRSVS
jgi:hypothetical protein